MKKYLLVYIFAALLVSGCRTADPRASNANSSANSNTTAATKDKSEEEVMADVFNEECGCRALYNLILKDGGQEPAAVAGNMVASDSEDTYPMIMKSPDKYYGQAVVITGKIIQIREQKVKDGYITEAMVALDRYQKHLVDAIGGLQTPFLEGDKVSVVGYLANHLYHYKSVAQWDMSVPLVVMRQMIKSSDALRFRVPAPSGTKDMQYEADTYAKTFEQNVNIVCLKNPDQNRAEIINSALDRVRLATDKNAAKYEKSKNQRPLKLTRLMREGAEKKAAELLAEGQN